MLTKQYLIPSKDYVFVFGANDKGRHGVGAALWARNNRGAIYGQGEGRQGNSYGIVTKYELPNSKKLAPCSLDLIYQGVRLFICHAFASPYESFFVSRIGCGLAGYKNEQIAPLFVNAIKDAKLYSPDAGLNCWFDPAWKDFGLQVYDAKMEHSLAG